MPLTASHSLSYPSVIPQVSIAAFSFLFSPVALPLSLSLSRPLPHKSIAVESLSSIGLPVHLDILAFLHQIKHQLGVHFCQAAVILFLTSSPGSPQPPLAFITDPTYLNVSVCFNKCRVLSLIISVSFILA